jgi:hypothetical protein
MEVIRDPINRTVFQQGNEYYVISGGRFTRISREGMMAAQVEGYAVRQVNASIANGEMVVGSHALNQNAFVQSLNHMYKDGHPGVMDLAYSNNPRGRLPFTVAQMAAHAAEEVYNPAGRVPGVPAPRPAAPVYRMPGGAAIAPHETVAAPMP